MKTLWIFVLFVSTSLAKLGFGPGEQDWDFVKVRPHAYNFWWLYETTANVNNSIERPLVIWLQGGPGDSSTGYGNFAEIGPLDVDLNPREHTWVKDVNLLFIDNPVGTGFSYVENDAYAQDNLQIALDLIACIKGFYKRRPEFRSVPLYITSEAYGGKMAVQFALELHKKIQRGEIVSNLQGVTMIDPWISPLDTVLNWAPYLWNVGVIDQEGYAEVDKAARLTNKLFVEGKFVDSTFQWAITEGVITRVSKNVDFYNILKCTDCNDTTDEKLEQIMNNGVREALNITRIWGTHSGIVFDKLAEDFMKPVTHIVEELLNTTTLKVQVVTGQLDLIVDTPGTILWVDRLKWNRSNEWASVPRNELSVNNVKEGYKKILGNFSVYWVNRAGQNVPDDNPKAMSSILADLIA